MEDVKTMNLFDSPMPTAQCTAKTDEEDCWKIRKTPVRLYSQTELRKLPISEIECMLHEINPSYAIQYLEEKNIPKSVWDKGGDTLYKLMENEVETQGVRAVVQCYVTKEKSKEDREETLNSREYKCDAKLILDGLLMENEENHTTIGSINSLAIQKNLYDLAFIYNLGTTFGLYTDVISEAIKHFSLDGTCLLVELAIAIKEGKLEYLTIAKELEKFKEQDPYEFAKIILQKHGVFYKSASRNKNAIYAVTENKWGYSVYPILLSAYSLSKNKTSIRISGLKNTHFKPSFVFRYITTLNEQGNSKSRGRIDGVMNNFILHVADKFNCDFGVTVFRRKRHSTGYDAYDNTIRACNLRILKAMFNTMQTKDVKYASTIAALVDSRREAAKSQAENKDKDYTMRFAGMPEGFAYNPLGDTPNFTEETITEFKERRAKSAEKTKKEKEIEQLIEEHKEEDDE